MSFTPGAMTVGIEPQLFVIFGGTGDLSRRKLLPALFRLLESRQFEDTVEVLAVGTGPLSDEEFGDRVAKALAEDGLDSATDWCRRSVHYHSLREGFESLANRVEELEAASQLPGNRTFYLAIPPAVFDDTVESLGKVGLASGPGWSRVVVEKPFGTDSASAHQLNSLLHRWFDEGQIYRIDHYLGKESVQNLLALRFANPLFESSWNRDRIDSVQITVAEDIGIGTRAGYYERAGAIRDIVQNHALQILTLVAMEPPVRLDPEAIRDEKVKVLRSIFPVDTSQVVRGQYHAGTVDGVDVAGYRQEPKVNPDSVTETFVALQFMIDNWRWKDVPFLVRAGKRLPGRVTEISVVFKQPPVALFEVHGSCHMHPNVFDIRLQPAEGFELAFEMKVPGEGYDLNTQRLEFRYAAEFGELPGAYVTLLADVMTGDQTLFVRGDEVEEAWRIITPALDLGEEPDPYSAGSWGPAAADALLARTGRKWQEPRLSRTASS